MGIRKYKTERIGLLSKVSAIVEDVQFGDVMFCIGTMEIAPSKRHVTVITHDGQTLGSYTTCTRAKMVLIEWFESQREKKIKKELEINVDNDKEISYTELEATSTTTIQIKKEESVTMAKSTNTTKKVATTKVNNNVKVVSKIVSDSKTRGTEETMKVTFFPTYAQVNSGSGSKYIVTKESCTCPDHMYRGCDKVDENGTVVKKATICRHRTAVSDVIEKMRKDVKYW